MLYDKAEQLEEIDHFLRSIESMGDDSLAIERIGFEISVYLFQSV